MPNADTSQSHPIAAPDDPRALASAVVEACLAMGFARAGVAAAVASARGKEFVEYLGAGKHGEMGYLAEAVEERLDVRRLLPGAKSVIVVADQYAGGRGEGRGERGEGREGTARVGVIAKYARGRDYHVVMRRRLRRLADRLRERSPGAKFRVFVDTAPVLEREQAARALLGTQDGGPAAFIGKHTLLIDPRLGSYLVLGGIVTTLELTGPDKAKAGWPSGVDHCGTCTKCIDACPTGAITAYSVDARRCVSYLTIEHSGVIDPAMHGGVGDRLFGCDVCQDVCPYNAAHEGHHGQGRVNAAYLEGARGRERLDLLEVLGWTEQDRRRALSGSAAKRASLEMFRRNALIAIGNHKDLSAVERSRVEAIAADEREDKVVRETARQVLARLGDAGEPFPLPLDA